MMNNMLHNNLYGGIIKSVIPGVKLPKVKSVRDRSCMQRTLHVSYAKIAQYIDNRCRERDSVVSPDRFRFRNDRKSTISIILLVPDRIKKQHLQKV